MKFTLVREWSLTAPPWVAAMVMLSACASRPGGDAPSEDSSEPVQATVGATGTGPTARVEEPGLGRNTSSAPPSVQCSDPASPSMSKTPSNELREALRGSAFVGEVVAERVTGRDGVMGRASVPAIWSDIEFRVGRTVIDRIGRPDASVLHLSFLGGTIGERAMYTSTSPHFAEGDHLLLVMGGDHESPDHGFPREVLRVADGRVFTYGGHAVIGVTLDRLLIAPLAAPAAAPSLVPLGTARGRSIPSPVVAPQAALTVEATLDALRTLSSTP